MSKKMPKEVDLVTHAFPGVELHKHRSWCDLLKDTTNICTCGVERANDRKKFSKKLAYLLSESGKFKSKMNFLGQEVYQLCFDSSSTGRIDLLDGISTVCGKMHGLIRELEGKVSESKKDDTKQIDMFENDEKKGTK